MTQHSHITARLLAAGDTEAATAIGDLADAVKAALHWFDQHEEDLVRIDFKPGPRGTLRAALRKAGVTP